MFESFTHHQRESLENVPLSIQTSDTGLTLENTVFEESVTESALEKSDDVLLVQPGEVVTKSQEKIARQT